MRVIKAARTAATEQHNDTVVALGKTDAAIAESRRLADAANKSADLAEARSRPGRGLTLSKPSELSLGADGILSSSVGSTSSTVASLAIIWHPAMPPLQQPRTQFCFRAGSFEQCQ
jgi:hypothetical protein